MENFVELGISNRPHGIKGGFIFKLKNLEESILKDGFKITIKPLSAASSLETEGREVTIGKIHFGNKTICYLQGIRDRNIVESILPFTIFASRDLFPELKDGEWYLEDLKGLDVYDVDGYKLGKVLSFFDNGAQPVLKVKLENETIELPFVDVFFPKVDIKSKKITIVLPEYDS
jgi:16S rRNA processing protein RimM